MFCSFVFFSKSCSQLALWKGILLKFCSFSKILGCPREAGMERNFIQVLFFFFLKKILGCPQLALMERILSKFCSFFQILGCPRLAGMEKELGAAETESLVEEESHIDSSELHGWKNSCNHYILPLLSLFTQSVQTCRAPTQVLL